MQQITAKRKRNRLAVAAASLLVAGGSMVGIAVASPAAQAGLVPNRMLCEPDTGWCFQTNPPADPSVPHACQWDYKLNGNNLRSGMYYTGCTPGWWGPDIH